MGPGGAPPHGGRESDTRHARSAARERGGAMTRWIPACWALVTLAGGAALVATSRSAWNARAAAGLSVLERDSIAALTEELASLRARQPVDRAPATGLAP